MRIIVFLALFVLPFAARAQMSTVPTPFNGQASIAVSNSSVAVTGGNVTLAPKSSAYPSTALPYGVLRIKNQPSSTAVLAVCWRGGTCTTAAGEGLAAGESRVVALPGFAANPPTLICASATACQADIEW